MKKHWMKACCAVLAASMLLSGCGNVPTETTESSTAATTPEVTTPIATTTDTSSVEQTTSATETTAKTTTDTTSEQETTTETTYATETTSYLPVVDASKYGTVSMTEEELRDKVIGGWIGQMVGVSWTAKTEFKATGSLLSDNLLPAWNPDTINDAFGQDDVYVEIPFIDAMIANGAFCSSTYLAESFRHSSFPVWHANAAGRDNLREGLSIPNSGHYAANAHADDIDWQIECDFLGQIYPGLVNEAALRAFDIGHTMNYGDGVYGGVFVTAMHSAAYTATSIKQIVEAGMDVIPDGTKFKDVMNIVMDCYNKGQTWIDAWNAVETAYGTEDKCPQGSNDAYNIDAKLNASYIVIGLLWGNGDFEQTIRISCYCGQDSDCNPSSAAAILGNYIGASNIPDTFKSALKAETIFSSTDYSFDAVIDANMTLMKEVITAYGATEENGVWQIKTNLSAEEVPFEQWPDTFGVGVAYSNLGNGVLRLYYGITGDEGVKSFTMDMGDGNVLNDMVSAYAYQHTGEYTVKINAVGEKGTVFEDEITVIVPADINATVIGSEITTAEGGSTNLSALYDGILAYKNTIAPADAFVNFVSADNNVYVGLEFDKTYVITGLKFVEGANVGKGGWFAAAPTIEVLVNGEWIEAELGRYSEYPIGNRTVHRDPHEVYWFNFETPIACDGVRIVGQHPAGGFVSVTEITPLYDALANYEEFDNDYMAIIVDQPSPQGSGSKNIGIIADGKAGTSNSTQYDTYDGSTAERTEYVGYLFSDVKKVSSVEFTEGGNFNGGGGWFKNGEIAIEALINGVWTKVDTTVSPSYPNGDTYETFGNSYETYVFTLNSSVECEGIRVIGTAGGPQHFISVSELTVK